MAGTEHQRGRPIAGINVTPFVDVALVLLVIFVVTAKIIVTPAIPLDLPRASETSEVQVVLSIIVPQQGPVLVNGEPADDAGRFAAMCVNVLAEHPEVRAVVHAEAQATHAQVLQTLDRLRRVGIHRVAFAAEPVAGGSP